MKPSMEIARQFRARFPGRTCGSIAGRTFAASGDLAAHLGAGRCEPVLEAVVSAARAAVARSPPLSMSLPAAVPWCGRRPPGAGKGDDGNVRGSDGARDRGGTGIGRAIAGKLHAEGAFVFICGRRAEKLEQARAAIAPGGERIAAVPADLTREHDVQSVARAVEGRGEGLDVLVNAAGIMQFGRLDGLSPTDMKSLFDTNAFAPWRLSVSVLPFMRQRGGGAIVNIASISGLRPFEGSGAYCMSKAALIMLTQVMALELAGEGVRVNAVCPGMVENTELGNEVFTPGQVSASYDRFRPLHPLGRNGTPEDVAEAVLYLCGASSSWVTGAILPLDGGRHLTTNRSA
jgi:NAD(P)-dependent dehydrogenase (short-subunit alcohol dehydrogenase family)